MVASENISRKGPRNCISLGCAPTARRGRRDDKGKGNGLIESNYWREGVFITLGRPQALRENRKETH
jgi:hypothetical protein